MVERRIALGPDPLRDHLTGVCGVGCAYCAKRRRRLLEEVVHAAWHMLDDGGESDDQDLFLVTRHQWDQLSAALDALEADGWRHGGVVGVPVTGSPDD